MNRPDPLPVDPEPGPGDRDGAGDTAGVFAVVAAGGALGTAARAALDQLVPVGAGQVPFTTLAVNLSGAFLLGVVVVLIGRGPSGSRLGSFLVTGVLGGFTTFSTWMVQTVQLGRHGHPWVATGYLLGAALGGLLGVSVGVAVGRSLAAAVRNRWIR